MDIILTNAGIALLQSQGGAVTVDKVTLGSAYGYTPNPADTNIHGSPVANAVPNKPLALNGNLYEYSALFDYQSPAFTFGEAGLFAGNTLFALAVATQAITKNEDVYLRLDAYLQIQGQNYEMWINAVPSNNQFRLAVLQSPDQLPNPKDAWPNAYVIQAGGSYDSSLAYTDRGRLWSFAAWRPAGNISIVSADTMSVTVKRTDLTGDMTPTYFGSIISQISSGKDIGTCRIVESLVLNGDSATFNFATPLAIVPQPNDTIIIYVRAIEDTGPGYILPPAKSNQLGGVMVGDGLTVTEDGLLAAKVTSVAGRTGNVTIKAADVLGLAAVATSGSYNDLVGKPGPYILPNATNVSLGGVKVGNTLTIDADGVLNATGYSLPIASASTLGGVKVGSGLAIDGAGLLSLNYSSPVTSVNTKTGAVSIYIKDAQLEGGAGYTLIGSSGQATGVMELKRIIPGNGITITPTSLQNLTISSTSPVASVSGQTGAVVVQASDNNATTGVSLISNSGSTTGDIKLLRLVAGAGITIAPDSVGNLTVSAVQTGLVKTVNGQAADTNGNVDTTPFNNSVGTGVSVIVSGSVNGKPMLAKVNAATPEISVQRDNNANVSIGVVKGSVVKSVNGVLPDQTGNLVFNPSLPGLRFELGTSGQPNNGFGIDKGTYWQADANGGGWTPLNGLAFTPQTDGTYILPAGFYLVTIGAKIVVDNGSDNYALPAQMIVAVNSTLAYGFPGIYQEGTQIFPDYPIVAASASGTLYSGALGFVKGSGTINMGTGPGFLGFSKVLGAKNNTPLKLQGYVTLLKIG